MKKLISVAAIENGTVIDHIPAGQGTQLVRLLRLTAHKKKVTLLLNLPSQSMGYKDLIKVEAREISEEEASQIAVFAPKATLNIIREYHVVKKFTVTMPEHIEKVIRCPNERCITNHEREISTRFGVNRFGNKVQLVCQFCEKSFTHDTY